MLEIVFSILYRNTEAGEVPAKKNGFGSEEQQIKAFKVSDDNVASRSTQLMIFIRFYLAA